MSILKVLFFHISYSLVPKIAFSLKYFLRQKFSKAAMYYEKPVFIRSYFGSFMENEIKRLVPTVLKLGSKEKNSSRQQMYREMKNQRTNLQK